MERRHFTLYRSRRGKIFGVFQGIADAAGLDAFWLRIFAILLALFTAALPVVLTYVAAALLMKPEPTLPLGPGEEEFYNTMTSSRAFALKRLSEKLDSLEKRTQFVENVVTSRGWDWDSRMRG